MVADKAVTLKVRFGRLLAANRTIAGFTQAELAERADLSVDMIAKLETGATGPSFDSIERLAQALRIDPAQLFTHELAGSPYERRAFTDFVAEFAKLPEPDLRWLTDVVRAAMKPRR